MEMWEIFLYELFIMKKKTIFNETCLDLQFF